MALYKVTNKKTGDRNLVEASTPAGALKRAARDLFDVETVSSPALAASIAASGVLILQADPETDEQEAPSGNAPESEETK